MSKRTISKEEKEKQIEVGKTLKALTHACEPFYQTLIADDVRHDRDSLAKRMDEFIRKDPQMQKYRDAIMAHTVIDRIIAKTSAHHFIDDRQMHMFSTEDDLREFLKKCTFECGDGLVLRASAVTYLDLEHEQARKEKNRQRVNEACDEAAAKLKLLRPLMVDQGMSRTDAEIVIWRQVVGASEVTGDNHVE
jgi:hypothetical protein